MPDRTTLPGNNRLPLYPLRVFRVDLAQSWAVWMLGNQYHGLFTRWVGTRANGRGHYVPREEWGEPKLIWKGYASALVWKNHEKHWLPVCFEITERCELDLRDRYARGQIWQISRAARQKKNDNPPVRAQLLESKQPNETPPELDLVPCLRNVYHVAEIDLSAQNPLPPITMVEPYIPPPRAEKTSDNAAPNKAPVIPPKLADRGKMNGQLVEGIG